MFGYSAFRKDSDPLMQAHFEGQALFHHNQLYKGCSLFPLSPQQPWYVVGQV